MRVRLTPAMLPIALLLAVTGCAGEREAAPEPSFEMANPASKNCIAQGGQVQIETAGDGGQYGVCLFEDNRQCEEWALLRGTCPAGGIKVTGYITPQARYCAIRGGDYTVTRDEYTVTQEETTASPEQGLCTLPGQSPCDALALYDGRCR